jgi:hypothetical protein
MAMTSYYERVAQNLLKGMPRPRPFGRLVNGRFLTGHQSQHRAPQGVRWRQFWRIKRFING